MPRSVEELSGTLIETSTGHGPEMASQVRRRRSRGESWPARSPSSIRPSGGSGVARFGKLDPWAKSWVPRDEGGPGGLPGVRAGRPDATRSEGRIQTLCRSHGGSSRPVSRALPAPAGPTSGIAPEAHRRLARAPLRTVTRTLGSGPASIGPPRWSLRWVESGRPFSKSEPADAATGPGRIPVRHVRGGSGAGARIRTWELLREQILSLPPLAARPPRLGEERSRHSLFVFRLLCVRPPFVDLDRGGQPGGSLPRRVYRLFGGAGSPPPARAQRHPTRPPASQAGPDPSSGAQARANSPTLHPVHRTTSAVELAVLRSEPHVVSHSDPSGESRVPGREVGLSCEGLLLGEGEQVIDPLARDADHRGRSATPPPRGPYGCGCWHTGQ